jgi:hypothetical protein
MRCLTDICSEVRRERLAMSSLSARIGVDEVADEKLLNTAMVPLDVSSYRFDVSNFDCPSGMRVNFDEASAVGPNTSKNLADN